ncbi:chloramphenicol acetyltransferase [Flavobacterium sp. NST-5]|uniref:Chloramphenicol acetyltransferase n=1 Tax=Flavobacterium ichthyis TaxID=2698827 RepID=A0ABW9Z8R4_9FLAO|nr:chloramphenicol acetyltransferase [Flavobacterium ichthyis]NBL65009.1 chloramphenicol acetyltransferase [Flavobacterium ichthyis]
MKKKLDLNNWPRKEHFEFFSKFDEPFFGMIAEVDCTIAYQKAKENNHSFYISYLHKTLAAVNAIENFKYRIHGNEIFIFDQIDASTTVMRKDNTFGFSLMPFSPDFSTFVKTTQAETIRVQETPGLLTRTFELDNLIHFSAVPWIKFTSLSHARNFSFPDSCPKISIGKMEMHTNGKRTIPVSVHVHHGLMDGFHVGEFFATFQELLNR